MDFMDGTPGDGIAWTGQLRCGRIAWLRVASQNQSAPEKSSTPAKPAWKAWMVRKRTPLCAAISAKGRSNPAKRMRSLSLDPEVRGAVHEGARGASELSQCLKDPCVRILVIGGLNDATSVELVEFAQNWDAGGVA